MSIVIAQDTVRNGLVHCKRQGRMTGSAHRDAAGAARKCRVADKLLEVIRREIPKQMPGCHPHR